HLLVKLVFAQRDDLAQSVALTQFPELGIVERIKLETLRVFALDEGQSVELRQRRCTSGQSEAVALTQRPFISSRTGADSQNRDRHECRGRSAKRSSRLHKLCLK